MSDAEKILRAWLILIVVVAVAFVAFGARHTNPPARQMDPAAVYRVR